MTRFTLKQLKYFVTVVETESIAEASRQLHIAQPSISIAIKNLEGTFEQQLFIRHHAQGVSLTPCGRRFYEKAKELLRLSWSLSKTRAPIRSWSPAPFRWAALNPLRRCICQSWWPDLKRCIQK
ncbi:HTH-type transcriptional regulator tdfR [Raoultella terrigena]|uniref:HTH-type transcriptional regulator tdfR n=1 Tax=Raoultella terrigena TaxID=577 RepID=A0A3P8JJ14_RAOTE|nr:HTH-type transcriptional regulator tdfR [Raoultella terrigena]